ncbi:MAG: IS1595 family transposase [Pseudomonadota bacterium]
MTPLRPSPAPSSSRGCPRNLTALRAAYPDDRACLDLLEELRWPGGFICPKCGRHKGIRLVDGRFWCEPCRRRSSVTTATLFHGARTPLTSWFAAAWHLTSRNGISAVNLQKLLRLGSYQTAWAMLHRLRAAMGRPGRDRLAGSVEVGLTPLGRMHPGPVRQGAAGQALVVIAVELSGTTGLGRCRLRLLPDAVGAGLSAFLRDCVMPGATLVIDKNLPLPQTAGATYRCHIVDAASICGRAGVLLPGAKRVSGAVQRWLARTHSSAAEADHLQAYLDEFAFRFGRLKSEPRFVLFRSLLELAVQVDTITFRSLVADQRTDGDATGDTGEPPPPGDSTEPGDEPDCLPTVPEGMAGGEEPTGA